MEPTVRRTNRLERIWESSQQKILEEDLEEVPEKVLKKVTAKVVEKVPENLREVASRAGGAKREESNEWRGTFAEDVCCSRGDAAQWQLRNVIKCGDVQRRLSIE